MIYGHGDELFRYGDKVKINFSSNVYGQADYTDLKEHLMQHFDVVGHYPEPDAHTLECLLAEKLGVKENTVMVTSGVKDEFDVLPKDRIYWICNPNNPTGNVLVKGMLNHIVRNHPRYLYVIDQSYADYTLAPMLDPKEMTDVFNLMLVHSLSKTFCIPGLRLGYIVASPIIIGRLKQIRQPWTINALAIEAGKYLIENNMQMIPDLKSYLQEAIRLYAKLSAINGLKVMKTDTNFMLVSIHNSTAIELKRWLLDNYGILIRDASNIRGLDSNYFRVTTQQPEENDLLVDAIKAYVDHLNEVSD